MRVKTSHDHTMQDGSMVCINFDRVTEGHRENYGADADGRRGMMMPMIDRDDAENVRVERYIDDTQTSEPLRLMDLAEGEVKQILAAIDQYLIDFPPEIEEYPEDDPDRDDE